MSRNELRLSQLLTTFGPGSMVDLPTHSVIIGGLDGWPYGAKGAMRTIDEPRLRTLLEREFREAKRIGPGDTLELKEPPTADELSFIERAPVPAYIFPEWLVCEPTDTADARAPRRMVKFRHLDNPARLEYKLDNKKVKATPIRFVAGCRKGHIQDIDWWSLVHGKDPCRGGEALYLVDRGTSGDPKDISVACDCGKQIALMALYTRGRLGFCHGHQPWLGANARDHEPCVDADGKPELLRFLTRGAAHAYYSQTVRLISLPQEEDALTALVRTWLPELEAVTSLDDWGLACKFNRGLKAAFARIAGADLFACLQRVRGEDASEGTADRGPGPRVPEFAVLTSGRRVIGSSDYQSRLYAETLPDAVWRRTDLPFDDVLERIVQVHRLREVTALFGFTRFEPAPGAYDDDQDELSLKVEGAVLARHARWLPAMEQFGEGLFIALDPSAIRARLHDATLIERLDALRRAYLAWLKQRGRQGEFYGYEYVLAHSLAHALMAEIALECGYPMTALKERIYALRGAGGKGEVKHCGLLIYTAGGGAQGTLGGLVEMAPRLPELITMALRRHRTCSNDPLCKTRKIGEGAGEPEINGAACHACLFVAETSCERGNSLLDRMLLATLAEWSQPATSPRAPEAPVTTTDQQVGASPSGEPHVLPELHFDPDDFDTQWHVPLAELRANGLGVEPGDDVMADGRVVDAYLAKLSASGQILYLVDGEQPSAEQLAQALNDQGRTALIVQPGEDILMRVRAALEERLL